ncbi:MAG: recombinase family protein [Capsulimonadaceae bacterium]|nr:recombinase family protein [Capsulimonadaceae bacterium]
MALLGYARVSTLAGQQTTDLQVDALNAIGCEKIFSDFASGARTDRKGLGELLEYARQGDTLCVWRLDRLGRSLKHLIEVITDLERRGIGFRSLSENIDTTTAAGQLLFHLMGALAQFERTLIRERVVAGLEAARKRGRHGGRPRAVDASKAAAIAAMTAQGLAVVDICKSLKISRATYYRNREADVSAEKQSPSPS